MYKSSTDKRIDKEVSAYYNKLIDGGMDEEEAQEKADEYYDYLQGQYSEHCSACYKSMHGE